MAEYLIQSKTLDAIAEAINHKAGTQATMTPAEMVTAIGNIPTGGGGGTQTISFLDWLNNGITTTGTYNPNNTRVVCPHGFYKCQSISIPTGIEFVIAAYTAPEIANSSSPVLGPASFVGFWNGTDYTSSYTWFDQQTFDLTEIDSWGNYYFIILLRNQNNTQINTNEGNNVVITFNYSNGAKFY